MDVLNVTLQLYALVALLDIIIIVPHIHAFNVEFRSRDAMYAVILQTA